MRIALTDVSVFRRSDMLMITRSEGSDLTHTLKVEGKLLGPWIGELESACRESNFDPDRVLLDLARVTFVDAEGARLLKGLIRDGAQVVACTGFVAEMLHHEWP
jgi:hypothetical protein